MDFKVIDYCDICGVDVDHDGHVECEVCHKFYCANHNTLMKVYGGELLCQDCLIKAEKGIFLTKKQFDLAVQIKEAQDKLEYWENEPGLLDSEDKSKCEAYECARSVCIEIYQERLKELTGNPRGYL